MSKHQGFAIIIGSSFCNRKYEFLKNKGSGNVRIFIAIIAAFIIAPFILTSPAAAEAGDTPQIDSESGIVMEANTGRILYEKNAEERLYPASLTKIATAIYAIEHGDLDDMVTVSKQASETGGSSVFLKEGDQMRLGQLIQGLLLNSGNDAGVAIAEHLSGSSGQFAKDLNVYLKEEVGVENTTFFNPHGLFDPRHMTTAEDLARITAYAMKNDTFKEMFGKKQIDWDSESWDTTLYTHHKLMREMPYDGVTGGKTGYVGQAGFTLATSAERDGTSLVAITMKNSTQLGAYHDTEKLLDYGFDNFETTTVSPDDVYDFMGEPYAVEEPLTYTHSTNHPIDQNVILPGVLIISNQMGDVLTSGMLRQVDRKRTTAGALSAVVKVDDIWDYTGHPLDQDLTALKY